MAELRHHRRLLDEAQLVGADLNLTHGGSIFGRRQHLFFSQLVSLNTQHLPEQDPNLKVQCLLVNDEFAAMGRVGVISSAAAFLAGYNLRLTVVQAMSQLDAVYGDKDARTFATNHGLQILYAPREQRDADEYSAMLGQFTERATSRGRSRSFSQHGHSSVSIRYSERLAEAGIEPSVGSRGDSYDNALAETINGLYKAELIHRRAPWKTREAVELATLEWVSWFNHHRLLEPIGHVPPAEFELNYYRQLAASAITV